MKLNSAREVSTILANRQKLWGISIKPDMAKQEREIESLLLKERRSLITSGKKSKEIKIRGKSLYVLSCPPATRISPLANSVHEQEDRAVGRSSTLLQSFVAGW